MQTNKATGEVFSDEELIKDFPGFSNHYFNANGVQIHYVKGGTGKPLICLPGWPQTWYSYHPVAAQLANDYTVIIVDIRGMGSSGKPSSGYDKKTMAADVYALVKELGFSKTNLMGHDIGGMVAMSFAYNYQDAVEKLIVLDGMHPSQGMLQMPLIPSAGSFQNKMDANQPYAWWMSFNQVKDLPEKLLAGRFRILLDWLFNYVMIDDTKITEKERAIYSSVYDQPENIKSANAWYQSFAQDIEDSKTYQPISAPVLGICSYVSYQYMKMGLPYSALNVEVIGILDSGHYLFEEKPNEVIKHVTEFLSE